MIQHVNLMCLFPGWSGSRYWETEIWKVLHLQTCVSIPYFPKYLFNNLSLRANEITAGDAFCIISSFLCHTSVHPRFLQEYLRQCKSYRVLPWSDDVYSLRVLLVDRQESRPAEWLARKFFAGFSYFSPGFMSIPIKYVARAMVANTLSEEGKSVEILENKDIYNLGKCAE